MEHETDPAKIDARIREEGRKAAEKAASIDLRRDFPDEDPFEVDLDSLQAKYADDLQKL